MTDATFAQVLAHPYSVHAREALATHWLSIGDPRGELLEKQIKERTGFGLDTMWDELSDIRRLINKHGDEWAGKVRELVDHYEYELGLVSCVGLSGIQFIERAAELVQLAPIIHLRVKGPVDMKQLATTPELSNIRTLAIEAGPWLDDDAIEALTSSPYLKALRTLDVSRGLVADRGLRALNGAPNMPQLVYADVTGNAGLDSSSIGAVWNLREINKRRYVLTSEGFDWLGIAQKQAAQTYDPWGLEWPPSLIELSYTD